MGHKEKGIDATNTVGTLEIYHISISLGDTAVLVTRDSKNKIINTVLIDLGCNHEEVLKWCRESNSIEGFNDEKNAIFDYVIVSHNHEDHIAGIQYGLLKCDQIIYSYVSDPKIFKGKYRKHKSTVDKVKKKPKLGKVERNKELNLLDVLKVTDAKDSLYTILLAKNIELKCICANGVYLNEKGEKVVHAGNFNSWNDHSIAWLLEYKNDKEEVKFRYFTAGDLSGDNAGNYTDIESELIPFFESNKITVDLLKATHHGSKHSLTEDFIKTIKPKEIIVPCNNSHLLPFPQFFQRLHKIKSVDKTFKPKVFIANYMHFNFSKYLKKIIIKKEKVDKKQMLEIFGDTTPKIKEIKIGKSFYITTVDTRKEKKKKRKREQKGNNKEVKIADMKVFKTSMIQGEFKTAALQTEITCEIKAPAHVSERLPELANNLFLSSEDEIKNSFKFAIDSLYLVYKESEEKIGELKIGEVEKNLLNNLYVLDKNKNCYVQKEEVDEAFEALRVDLLHAFKQVFHKDPDLKNMVNKPFLNPSFNSNKEKKIGSRTITNFKKIHDRAFKKFKKDDQRLYYFCNIHDTYICLENNDS